MPRNSVDVSEVSASVTFEDSNSVPVWARDGLSKLCSMGIISYEGTTINASAELTRAEAAEYLHNMLKYTA